MAQSRTVSETNKEAWVDDCLILILLSVLFFSLVDKELELGCQPQKSLFRLATSVSTVDSDRWIRKRSIWARSKSQKGHRKFLSRGHHCRSSKGRKSKDSGRNDVTLPQLK